MAQNRRPGPWDDPALRARCLREAQLYLVGTEAEDAVQEALIRAWLKRDEWVPQHAERAWLVKATRWEAIRVLKQSARALPVDELPREPSADDPELEQLALRLDVVRELSTLSAEERELLELRYGEDLTQPVIAERLELPEGTVKIRLHRLRALLRDALGE